MANTYKGATLQLRDTVVLAALLQRRQDGKKNLSFKIDRSKPRYQPRLLACIFLANCGFVTFWDTPVVLSDPQDIYGKFTRSVAITGKGVTFLRSLVSRMKTTVDFVERVLAAEVK